MNDRMRDVTLAELESVSGGGGRCAPIQMAATCVVVKGATFCPPPANTQIMLACDTSDEENDFWSAVFEGNYTPN
jgi:hypothetical protein